MLITRLQGDSSLASRFSSASQRARVVSEAWIASEGYCIACDSENLLPTVANTQVRDFECTLCGNPYELKSSSRPLGKKIVDGSYGAMMERIRAGTAPNLFLLEYSRDWHIENLWAVHRLLITEVAIQQRKPLSATARRAGWTGCNILLERIPPEGRIPVIIERQAIARAHVRKRYAATEALNRESPVSRGWAAAVLSALHRLNKSQFTISDAYLLEPEMSRLYPNNRNVRAKIRQQLQILRDAGLLLFEERGQYSLTMQTQVDMPGTL